MSEKSIERKSFKCEKCGHVYKMRMRDIFGHEIDCGINHEDGKCRCIWGSIYVNGCQLE